MVVADRLLCRGQNFSKCRVTVDEIAVKINGEWSRLYAAVDIEPELIFAFGRKALEKESWVPAVVFWYVNGSSPQYCPDVWWWDSVCRNT